MLLIHYYILIFSLFNMSLYITDITGLISSQWIVLPKQLDLSEKNGLFGFTMISLLVSKPIFLVFSSLNLNDLSNDINYFFWLVIISFWLRLSIFWYLIYSNIIVFLILYFLFSYYGLSRDLRETNRLRIFQF